MPFPPSINFLLAALSSALFFSAVLVQAQECSAPEFYASSTIVAVGTRAFGVNTGSGVCNTSGAVSGNVYLVRPGDSSFSPLSMGYFNSSVGSSSSNIILEPAPDTLGYGYRVVIAPDASSAVSSPLASSPTFALVASDWFGESSGALRLDEPSAGTDSETWGAEGKQVIAWQTNDAVVDSFSVLLYNSNDATASPVTLVENVPNTYVGPITNEYYFTPESALPTGSGYQIAVVPSTSDASSVLAMSGLIQINAGQSGPNSIPFTYTQVQTMGGSSVTGASSSTSSGSATPTSSGSTSSGSSTSAATTSVTTSTVPALAFSTSSGSVFAISTDYGTITLIPTASLPSTPSASSTSSSSSTITPTTLTVTPSAFTETTSSSGTLVVVTVVVTPTATPAGAGESSPSSPGSLPNASPSRSSASSTRPLSHFRYYLIFAVAALSALVL